VATGPPPGGQDHGDEEPRPQGIADDAELQFADIASVITKRKLENGSATVLQPHDQSTEPHVFLKVDWMVQETDIAEGGQGVYGMTDITDWTSKTRRRSTV